MNVLCNMSHFAKAKFDEPGRQRAIDRLDVLDSEAEAPFERIVDLVKTTMNAPICAVSMIDNERQWFKAFRGLSVNQTPRNIAFCDYAIRAEAPFVIEDALRDLRFANNPLVLGEPFIRAYLGIPLVMPDGYIAGTLCAMYQEPREFTEQEVAILRSFANLVVGELELRTLAFTDGLTSLLSRKAWRDRVQTELNRATKNSTVVAILLLDLDHFKRINDTYGHEIGDLVLREAAEAMVGVLSECDHVGRIGGEEFAICIPKANLTAGIAVAERVRARIEALQFPHHEGLSCRASIGVAVMEKTDTVDELLKRADLALYKAKILGRNQVHSG